MGEALVIGNKRKRLEETLVFPDVSLKSHLSSRIDIGQTYPDWKLGEFGESTIDKTHNFTVFLNYHLQSFMALIFLI